MHFAIRFVLYWLSRMSGPIFCTSWPAIGQRRLHCDSMFIPVPMMNIGRLPVWSHESSAAIVCLTTHPLNHFRQNPECRPPHLYRLGESSAADHLLNRPLADASHGRDFPDLQPLGR